jgi:hypothetical protein
MAFLVLYSRVESGTVSKINSTTYTHAATFTIVTHMHVHMTAQKYIIPAARVHVLHLAHQFDRRPAALITFPPLLFSVSRCAMLRCLRVVPACAYEARVRCCGA